MAKTLHNCGQCRFLKRTSPEQVFLLCTYWASPNRKYADYRWMCGHCHMQPWAPACFAFKPILKEVAA